MGSFNITCMVSQQVIVPNTEVVILPIAQQSTYNPVNITKNNDHFSQYGFAHTTCYPTAFWNYAGPMLRGTYDDYGQFNLLDTEENNLNIVSFFVHLKKNAFTTHVGENTCHENAFDIHSLFDPKKNYTFAELSSIWDSIWHVASKNRIFLHSYNGFPRNLKFTVMHHGAASYLINSVSEIKDYDDQCYEQKTYFKQYISNKLSHMMDVFKEKKLTDTFSFFGTQLYSLSSYGIGDQAGSYISQYYNIFDSIMDIIDNYHNNHPQSTELSDQYINELFDIFKSQINHRYIHAGLDMLNIKLTPMVYASQDYSNHTGKAYLKMVKTISAQINKEIKANK